MAPEHASLPQDRASRLAPAPDLTGAQRRYLRRVATKERPVVWVGEAGLSEGALRSVEEALDARELIKVRLRTPVDKKATARELSERSGAALCGLIGHTVILYRPHPDVDARQIELPGRDAE